MTSVAIGSSRLADRRQQPARHIPFRMEMRVDRRVVFTEQIGASRSTSAYRDGQMRRRERPDQSREPHLHWPGKHAGGGGWVGVGEGDAFLTGAIFSWSRYNWITANFRLV